MRRCDTLDKMKAHIPTLRAQLDDAKLFKQIYQFAFDLGRQENQKSLRTHKCIVC